MNGHRGANLGSSASTSGLGANSLTDRLYPENKLKEAARVKQNQLSTSSLQVDTTNATEGAKTFGTLRPKILMSSASAPSIGLNASAQGGISANQLLRGDLTNNSNGQADVGSAFEYNFHRPIFGPTTNRSEIGSRGLPNTLLSTSETTKYLSPVAGGNVYIALNYYCQISRLRRITVLAFYSFFLRGFAKATQDRNRNGFSMQRQRPTTSRRRRRL
jgi:hypothetical protein